MANQTIGVNLKFSADVSAAKRAMAELQGSLAQIHNAAATSANPGIRYAKDLNQASQAAAQLRIQLQSAFNQDTGKLNLTKFNMEMKQAGMSVEKYRAALTSIGPQGQQAFTQLAHSVAMAETNTISLSTGIRRLGTTFMNTLRYQLSSTVIMGFVRGISEAVTYVKDLNASLNDIRIVTNYGVDEMKEFANYANKAAKALSTTTNEYAKASLIYFQQGLTDKEVQKRTDLTIKMANVTGQAVGEVSDQLTSVWNNFDNGTKSLEHYVDVMVALGAATASSSEEISEGLNKFAAVAETVGLSYEYAAAALATVTATTRQSADIVGTAFKTLFARIQDLELGKELDDGTTLGQYSQALAAVGINIKDVNGEVKDMNSILDEMGAKWNTLSKDSQIALAQNVAGVRQYTQLIALMDNWDFFKQNLETANASTGSLQEQADIYAESWEAASQRVTASLETIYNKLLNDEFFIDATNLLADFIGLVENLVDGLGGMPGVLALVGVALTRVFSTQMAQGINNMAYNIRSMTKIGQQKNAKTQQEFLTAATEEYGVVGVKGQEGAIARAELDTQSTYLKNKTKMSELERQIFDTRMGEIDAQKKIINQELQETKILEDQAKVTKRLSQASIQGKESLQSRMGFGDARVYNAMFAEPNGYLQNGEIVAARGGRHFVSISKEAQDVAYKDLYHSSAATTINEQAINFSDEDTFGALTEDASVTSGVSQLKSIEELQSRLKELGVTSMQVEDQMRELVGPELSQRYQELAKATNEAEKEIKEYTQQLKQGDISQDDFEQSIRNSTNKIDQARQKLDALAQSMRTDSKEAILLSGGTRESANAMEENGIAAGNNQSRIMQLRQQYSGLGEDIKKSSLKVLNFGTAMQQSAMMISTLTMVITSLIGLFKTLSDEEIEPSEKITTVLTTLGFMLPMVIGLFNEQTKSLFLTAGAALAAAGGQKGLGDKTKITSFAMLEQTAIAKGLGKTLGKFAIYAAAIAVVVLAVTTLAKAADNARNSAENFAASATQGAKDAAEAYSEATTAFNELKDSISNYEEALNGLQKLTEGTNEYKQALFDANEQALALAQSHAGLKYYIDSNGLIIFEEGELDRIESEAQQKKADAYSAKLSADKAAREANIDYQKIQLGRKLEGRDYEWNDEDTAAAGTGAAIGAGAVGVAGGLAGGALIGAKLGQLGWAAGPVGALIGTVAGVIVGGLVGAIAGAGVSGFDNDATEQEQKAIDALYEAYKEQGDAALTEKGIRDALSEVGIDDENLILSLAKNEEATEDLMKAMEANTAAIEAETRSAAIQQAHSLDDLLQYKDSESQAAITEAMTRMRTQAAEKYDFDQNSYRKKGWFGWWYKENQTGTEAFNEWATAQGLTKKNVKTTNYSDNYIEYEYIDDEGQTQQKKLQYSQLAAWQESQAIDEYAKSAYENIKKAVEIAQVLKNNKGLMSIVGGQNLMTLSEKEVEEFKKVIDTAEYKNYIKNNWKALGYESEQAFIRAISEGIANYDPKEAFARFSKTLNAEIDGILSAGAEETEYTAGALENYTDALAENNKALHDNTNAWSNLEKKKFAAQAAVANTKFIKGVDALTEVLEDNLEILLKWDEAALDTYEAADKVQTALEDVFGVRVSADFIKNNFADIQALAQGSTENIEELSRAAAIDFALNIDTMSDETKGNFVAMLNQLADIAADKTIEVGTDINNDEYIAQLNQMLETGEITAEQIQQSFGALGYSPDIKFKTVEQKTRTTHYIYEPGQPDKTIISETVSDVQVPYIAGENTFEPAAEDGSDSGQEKGKGITKIRDIGSIGASLNDAKKEKAKKELIDELDIYKEINEQLNDMERILNRIAKAKDNAFGERKLDYLDYEIERQKELIELEKQKLGIAQGDMETKRRELDTDFHVDEKGNITNYYDYLKSIAGKIPDDKYNEIKDSADKYIEARNTYLDQWEKIINDENELFSKELETVTLKIDLDISLAEDALSLLDFQIETLGDGWDRASERFGHYIGKIGEEENKISSYMKGIKGILGKSVEGLTDEQILDPETFMSLLGDTELTSEQIELLRQYRDGILESTTNMLELRDTIRDDMISCFEDWNEEIDKQAETFDRVSKSIQGYRDIIDLVGKDVLGVSNELLNKMNETNIQNTQNALKASKSVLDNDVASLEYAKQQYEAMEKVGDEEGKKFWKSVIDPLEESVAKRQDEYMTNWKNSLQAAADALKDSVDQIMDSFETAMSGIAGSFDELSQKYDQQSEINERYLEDYEKIYNLSKMNRDIQNSLNDVDNIKSKQKLLELQEEIYKLQESGAKVTQYEVDEMQARYELRLAEIALEEAQNAKSNVQMKRDSEGNWSYVYTADQENVAEAQQNVEDKLYNLQKVVSDRRKIIEDELMSLPEEFADSVRRIAEDTTLSEEERNRRLEENAQYYTDKHRWITEQLGISLEDAKRLYNADWQTYSDATGYKISKNGEWITSFDGTVASELLGYDKLTTAHNNFEINTNTMMNKLTTAYETYKVNVAGAMEAAGTSISGFATTVGGDMDELKRKSDNAAGSIEKIGEDGKTAFKTLVDEAVSNWPKYNEKLNDYINKNTAWATAINGIIQKYATLNGMKFPNINAELDKVLAKLAQINGTNYTHVDPETETPDEGSLSFTTYKSSGTAEAISQGNMTYEEAESYGDVHSGQTTFTAKDFKGMTLNDVKVSGVNGHYFTQDDLGQIMNAGWLKKEETSKTGSGQYFGTYYDINGNLRRTSDLYETKAEAVDAAIKERKIYAKKIIQEHQYNKSIGRSAKETQYADATEEEVLKILREKGGTGTVDFSDNRIKNNISLTELGHEGETLKLDSVTDDNGETTSIYISKGNYSIQEPTPSDKDRRPYIVVSDFSKKAQQSVYRLTYEEVQKIRDTFGDNNIDSSLISGSGDLKYFDPVFEKDDIVDSIERQKEGDANLVKGYQLTQDYNTKKITMTGDGGYKAKNLKGAKVISEKPYIDTNNNGIYYYQVKTINDKTAWFPQHVLTAFDTGGYTGAWGPEGRLAMLHQKEIILNADDTANFLSAVNIVRDIASVIDLRAAAQQSALAALATATTANHTMQTLQQEVTIHAEFPNATQRTEIEAAFDTLLNRASQFANRKN